MASAPKPELPDYDLDPYAPPRGKLGPSDRGLWPGEVPFDLGCILGATWPAFRQRLGACVGLCGTVLVLTVSAQLLPLRWLGNCATAAGRAAASVPGAVRNLLRELRFWHLAGPGTEAGAAGPAPSRAPGARRGRSRRPLSADHPPGGVSPRVDHWHACSSQHVFWSDGGRDSGSPGPLEDPGGCRRHLAGVRLELLRRHEVLAVPLHDRRSERGRGRFAGGFVAGHAVRAW